MTSQVLKPTPAGLVDLVRSAFGPTLAGHAATLLASGEGGGLTLLQLSTRAEVRRFEHDRGMTADDFAGLRLDSHIIEDFPDLSLPPPVTS